MIVMRAELPKSQLFNFFQNSQIVSKLFGASYMIFLEEIIGVCFKA